MKKTNIFLFGLILAVLPGFATAIPITYFSEKQIQSREFVRIKKQEWEACHQPKGKRIFAGSTDPIEDFVESNDFQRNPVQMENAQLRTSILEEQPWSGDYWPYSRGLLGFRGGDQVFLSKEDWKERYDYILEESAAKILKEKGAAGLDLLSPAEKYDLITGQSKGPFAQANWLQGKAYYDKDGKVENWMGLCHGWAPAAIVEPRPVRSLTVPSKDQKYQVKLLPSEVKGLLSYSWANNPSGTKYLGSRCNEKEPPKDDKGRIENPECFDLNPGTWHQVVVNLIGVQKKSFIMDATYDFEVWNQPVLGYAYGYFNPKARAQVKTLQEALIQRKDFPEDSFAKYRDPRTTQFLGIVMQVAYIVEVTSNREETDTPDQDAIRTAMYVYDLELDAEGNILGGEWYDDTHPDFIWRPNQNAKPQSPLDPYLKNQPWDLNLAMPDLWVEAARRSSPRGILLHSIAETIGKASSAK